MYCNRCGAQIPEGDRACPRCGAATDITEAYGKNGVGLGWHKFLIYFALWAGAVMNFIDGVKFMTGAHYGTELADMVYAEYPALQPVDIVFGVVMFAMGVYYIVVRYRLAAFRMGAPRLLLLCYVIVLAIGWLYILAVAVFTGIVGIDITTIISLVISLAMIAANYVYYKKRKELFRY